MAKSGGGAGRSGGGGVAAKGGGYTGGTERQKKFADNLKQDAIKTINADSDKFLKMSRDSSASAKINDFRNALIERVMSDRDVNSVINKLDMNAWRIDLIAKAYNIKP